MMNIAAVALGCALAAGVAAAAGSPPLSPIAAQHVADDAGAPVVVGAIRWDAYWGKPGELKFEDPYSGIVTRTTTYDMSPTEWHYRTPFFGEEINDTAITADGDLPDVMGQELEYARVVVGSPKWRVVAERCWLVFLYCRCSICICRCVTAGRIVGDVLGHTGTPAPTASSSGRSATTRSAARTTTRRIRNAAPFSAAPTTSG